MCGKLQLLVVASRDVLAHWLHQIILTSSSTSDGNGSSKCRGLIPCAPGMANLRNFSWGLGCSIKLGPPSLDGIGWPCPKTSGSIWPFWRLLSEVHGQVGGLFPVEDSSKDIQGACALSCSKVRTIWDLFLPETEKIWKWGTKKNPQMGAASHDRPKTSLL